MNILMNKNLHNLKGIIEREIAENNGLPINISLEFDENINSKKDSFKLAYLKRLISKIETKYPNNKFTFEITYIKHNDFAISNDKCKTLEEINNYLIDNYNRELLIRRKTEVDRSFTFQSVINANRQIEYIIDKVNMAKKQYPSISNFEKFMILYDEVTNFIYKEEERYDQLNASHWISVVNGDSIVCTGYASLMQELASRVFNSKEVLVLENDVDVYDKRDDELISAHANNIIFIKDDKYDVKGLFYLDPCWDSIETKDEIKGYSYCCIPLKDIDNHKIFDIRFREVYRYNLKECYDTFFNIRKPIFKGFDNYDYLNNKNSLHYYINNYDYLENKSTIPLKAYFNSFKIIGELNGLKGDSLNQFIKERMDKSLSKTNYYFNINNCNSEFAKKIVKDKSNNTKSR